jgi:hypothetical protein
MAEGLVNTEPFARVHTKDLFQKIVSFLRDPIDFDALAVEFWVLRTEILEVRDLWVLLHLGTAH